MAAQLSALADRRPDLPDVPRYNPRPRGVIRDGSATQAVLFYMRSCPAGRYLTHAQILKGTGRPTKAVCWALIFLRSTGVIEVTSDDGRNARYLRYRLTLMGEKGE